MCCYYLLETIVINKEIGGKIKWQSIKNYQLVRLKQRSS